MVSQSHLEITRDGERFLVRDLASTNGTWLDGERIAQAELTTGQTIRLGAQGPEFKFIVERRASSALDQTVEIPMAAVAGATSTSTEPAREHDQALQDAVMQARRLRSEVGHGQTMTIMRQVIDRALNRTRSRWRRIVLGLVAALVITAAGGIWRIAVLVRQKHAIDDRIRQIETQLERSETSQEQADRLVTQLNEYETQAQSLQQDAFYRLGYHDSADYLTRELRAVMAEFGAEVYSVPPEFAERVNHYIDLNLGPNRPLLLRALQDQGGQIKLVRQIFEREQLPQDLAYIPVVESAVATDQSSAAGAAGPWQLMPATARAFGLRVDQHADERKDLLKSTQASAKILRSLILDFGGGSSVMLALAAYNLGSGKVKQAVVNTVRDPIKQRNFWYLYRTRALPAETREYVPKVFAAIVIGRDPRHFGL